MSQFVINLNKFKNQVNSTCAKIEINEDVLNRAKERNITPDYMVHHFIYKQNYLIAKDIWKVVGCNLYWRKDGNYIFFSINEDGDLKSIMSSEAQEIYFNFLNSIHGNIFEDGIPKEIKRNIPTLKEFPFKVFFDCRNWFDTDLLLDGYQVFKNDLLNRSIYKYYSYKGEVYCIYNSKFQVNCKDNGKVNIQMVYDYLYGDIKEFEEKYKDEIWYWKSSINILRNVSRVENENPANFLDKIN